MKTSVLACFLTFIAAVPIAAQFDAAAVLGSVRDASGAVVPGVTVTLQNQETGIKATAATDDNGNYMFPIVRIGLYTVAAEKTGFATAKATNVRVVVNARQRVDLQLVLGQVSESVQVSASVAAVESDSSDRGQVVSARQVVELPLNGRNYADLALLTTGVRKSDYASANPPREGSFNVNGQRSIFNNFMMDGLDNNAYGTSNQGFSSQVVQLTPDAVGEFKVVTANASAEYGRSSGAIINASMKSGTNSFHGSAWEFLRNTELNAVGFFRPAAGKPTLQRNQFGFTFGGPIVKNKAFFFTNYEGFRERQKFVTFSSLPTENDRRGIFSVAIRNPVTGEVYPANTPIPIASINPFAKRVLDDIPLPNNAPDNIRSNNWRLLRADKNNNDKMDAKLDGQVNSHNSAFIRVSHRKSNYFQAPEIPGLSGGGGNGFIRVLNQSIGTGWTWTVSPSALFEVRFGISKTRAGKEPPSLGGPSMQQLYGISGLSTDSRLAGGLTPQEITGFTNLGRQATNPQWQHPTLYNPKANYSFLRGRHSLKTGYEYQRVHTEIQDVNPLYGRDIYSGQFSRIPGSPNPNSFDQGSYNLGDFIFGARSEYQLVNFYIAQYRQTMHYAYLQDDFKVSGKLTLNLGVRYEYASPQWDANNRLSNFDPVTNTLIPAKPGSIADRAQVNPDRNNFAPRVGFAYSFNPKTVMRGAYGISYIHFNRAGGGNILGINGPQVVIAAISQRPGDPGYRPTPAGYPAGLTDPERFNPLLSNISYIPRDTPTGYVQTWSYSIQRELPGKWITDIGYVGNKSTHLILFADYNEARPNRPGENVPLQARRPNPNFAAITVTFPAAVSNYHALQARLERKFDNGFSVLNSFVWSKTIDTAGQALEAQNGSGGRASPQSFYNLQAERAVSDFDQPFNNTTAILFEVPFGRNRKFGASIPAFADAIAGGWQLNMINSLWSGQPVNLSYSPAASFQVSQTLPDWRGGISYRPNVVGPVLMPEGKRTIDTYLNPDNVVNPTNPSEPFGNAGRNIARRPGLAQLDLGVQKNFTLPWAERMALQFRAEAFNALNRTNFLNPTTNRSSAAFGTIRQTFPARQIQFALRLTF